MFTQLHPPVRIAQQRNTAAGAEICLGFQLRVELSQQRILSLLERWRCFNISQSSYSVLFREEAPVVCGDREEHHY